jgi:hypothetical protein
LSIISAVVVLLLKVMIINPISRIIPVNIIVIVLVLIHQFFHGSKSGHDAIKYLLHVLCLSYLTEIQN